jgi:peptidoglycan-N-acetylglucosamine deacetylase
VISRGDPNRRTVALTFDAGSDAGSTSQILDVLAQSGLHASFGITGQWAEAHPDLVSRIAAAGHLLMNHSYDHRSFTGTSARPALLTLAERRVDVERTDEIIQRITGRSTKPWFRSPYGDYDASVNAALGSFGYRYNVLWTVDSLGWQGASPATILSRTVGGSVPGAILLFHVGAASEDATALPAVISGLRQAGYGFGTVAEVVA